MTGAGKRNRRITFQEAIAGQDDYGNETIGWNPQFTVAARVQPRVGGEAIQAARLSGKQPYTIYVLSSSDTRRITTDWRAVDARDETRVFNIRTVANVDERNAEIEMMADVGVAT